MPAFDWANFFKANRIEYREESSREILIRCPWCGVNDPSKHLSINLEGKGFRCFRSDDHRGRNPARLVQVLLRCSIEHARTLCGAGATFRPNGKDFMAQVREMFLHASGAAIIKHPKLPEDFRPLKDVPSAWPYLSYMKSRGYDFKHILKLSELFELHYAIDGPFRGRVIFPIKRRGKLLNWTGRAISRDVIPRYRSHTTREDLSEKMGYDPAAEPITNLLLFHDHLEHMKAHTLVITEGPFDALRVNHFGLNQGIIATCLFTMQASPAQVTSLQNLIYTRFKRAVLLLDKGTLDKAVSISLKIPELKIKTLPDGVKDPGAIATIEQFQNLGLTIS